MYRKLLLPLPSIHLAIQKKGSFMFFARSKSLTALLILSVMPCAALAQNTTVGVGLGFLPKYEGSNQYGTRFSPLLKHRNGHFFLSPRSGMPAAGVQTELTENWTIGSFVSLSQARKSGDSARLHGMHDISRHGNLGVFTALQLGDVVLDASYYQALKSGYGSNFTADISYKLWQEGASQLRVGTELKWSNKKAMQTYFGVEPNEAAASNGNLHTYQASAGMRSYSVYGLATHQLSDSWHVHGLVGVNNLTSDAKNSPIVEKKSSVFGGLGLGYSF